MLSTLVSLPLPIERLIKPTCVVLAILCAAYGAAAFKSGFSQSRDAVVTIGIAAILVGSFVCVLALGARFLRWHLVLRVLGHRVSWAYDARVFAAGLAMSASPGKIGETLKAGLLVPVGVPLSRSLGALLADRLADVAAVASFGAAAAWYVGHRQPVLEVFSAVGIPASLGIAALVRASGRMNFWTLGEGRPRWLRWLHSSRAPLTAWSEVWTLQRLPALMLAGMIAFGLQGLVFGFYVHQLAPSVDVWVCLAIYSTSILIGAASLLPGGLGAMDAAMVLQLKAQGLPWSAALGATVAARVSSLTLPWLIGVLALLTFAKPVVVDTSLEGPTAR